MEIIIKILITFLIVTTTAQTSDTDLKIGRIKYSGGGDWYNDPSAEVNLLSFVKENTTISTNPKYEYVDLSSEDLYEYPVVFLTGHGNVNFSDKEINNLRLYLENGGFLYIDDDYGLEPYIKEEFKKVFPEKDFIEIPFSHNIYNIKYKFDNGPPKVHEHDKKPPKSYGLFLEDKMVAFFTVESNPSDGWADKRVHNNSQEIRIKSLQFGTNIILWALSN